MGLSAWRFLNIYHINKIRRLENISVYKSSAIFTVLFGNAILQARGKCRVGEAMNREIRLDRFYQGKRHALTMSYDDGKITDRRLVELFNRYGIKGTFHLNSGRLGQEKYIRAEEVKTLYAGHEVAGHSLNHPYLERLPAEALMREIREDRKQLEKLTGKLVQGFSYPYGTWNSQVISALRCCGIAYSRTTKSTGRFDLPEDFMKWHPTCHHREALLEKADLFLERTEKSFTNMLFYVWGHSNEFGTPRTERFVNI